MTFIEASPPKDDEIFSSFALILGATNYLIVLVTPRGIERELSENSHYFF